MPRDRILTSTIRSGGSRVSRGVNFVNAANRTSAMRTVLDKALGVHRRPGSPSTTATPCASGSRTDGAVSPGEPVGRTKGRVALFATCYGTTTSRSSARTWWPSSSITVFP